LTALRGVGAAAGETAAVAGDARAAVRTAGGEGPERAGRVVLVAAAERRGLEAVVLDWHDAGERWGHGDGGLLDLVEPGHGLFDHARAQDVRARRRGGDHGDGEGLRAARRHVAGEREALVGGPAVTDAVAARPEVDAQVDRVGAAGVPRLRARVRHGDVVELRLSGVPRGRRIAAVARRQRGASRRGRRRCRDGEGPAVNWGAARCASRRHKINRMGSRRSGWDRAVATGIL